MRTDFNLTPQMIQKAQELGHEPSSLPLLLLVPFIQVAWAEGSVQPSEQKAILRFAQWFNLVGTPGYEQLLRWFDERPPEEFFERSMTELRELLDRLPPKQAERLRSLLKFGCNEVAHSSGAVGFLRGSSNVHRDEREQLMNIGERLGLRHAGV